GHRLSCGVVPSHGGARSRGPAPASPYAAAPAGTAGRDLSGPRESDARAAGGPFPGQPEPEHRRSRRSARLLVQQRLFALVSAGIRAIAPAGAYAVIVARSSQTV